MVPAATRYCRYGLGMAQSDDHAAALAVLRTRHHAMRVVVSAVRETVENAREVGVSWAAIGEVFGVSAGEAQEMFGGEE